jgi:hypothetical protein
MIDRPQPETNAVLVQPPADEDRRARLVAGQRRLNRGLWIVGKLLEVFGFADDNTGNAMTWREASGKPPRRRRFARRRKP